MNLGRLQPVEVRAVWHHEAADFTPWLAQAENIALLAEALHLGEVEIEATEREVGRFSADIIARDEAGALVLIENQLEQTDHRHLGQVLTYLAGLEGDATVVWIATRFLEEHRAAIDWLNSNTNERFDFFGVELQVLRIGSSEPAPLFNVVAKPNDWSRGVRSVARQVSESTASDRQRTLLAYWTAFGTYLNERSSPFRIRKPNSDHWRSFPVGKSGFSINVTALVQQHRIGAEIYISRETAKADFAALRQDRADIEAEFGEQLRWDELPDRKGSRIAVQPLEADPNDEANWPAQHAWALDKIERFHAAFAKRIKNLSDFGVPPHAEPPASVQSSLPPG